MEAAVQVHDNLVVEKRLSEDDDDLFINFHIRMFRNLHRVGVKF